MILTEIKNKNILDNLISIIIICAFSMIFLSFYLNIQYATYFLFICIACSFLAFSIILINHTNKIIKLSLTFAVVSFLRYLMFFGSVKFVDTLIVVSIIFFATVVYLVQLNKTNRLILLISAIVCSLFLIIKRNGAQYYDENGWLKYVYQNPNTAASILLNLFTILILYSCIVKNKYSKIILWIIAIVLLFQIEKTSSRSSFIAGILFIVFMVFIAIKKIKPIFARILLLFPVIAIPIITIVFDMIFTEQSIMLNKALFSGREHLWVEALEVAFNNVINFENNYTSGLNVALKLLYLSGITGTVLFFILLFTIEKDSRVKSQNGRVSANLAIIALGIIVFEQSVESIMVSGSYAIAYVSMSLLGLVSLWRKQ